jgi:hypothetical protein
MSYTSIMWSVGFADFVRWRAGAGMTSLRESTPGQSRFNEESLPRIEFLLGY